jgi:hypothetical protein
MVLTLSRSSSEPSDVISEVAGRWKDLVRKCLTQNRGNALAEIRGHQQEKERRLHELRGKTLAKRIFGIGVDTEMMPASKLIYPFSPFGIGWMVFMAGSLFYTATIIPPVVAFHWLDEDCEFAAFELLVMDTIVDISFIIDVILTFNTGLITGGDYNDDRLILAKKYIKVIHRSEMHSRCLKRERMRKNEKMLFRKQISHAMAFAGYVFVRRDYLYSSFFLRARCPCNVHEIGGVGWWRSTTNCSGVTLCLKIPDPSLTHVAI